MEQPELRFASGADGTRIAYSTRGDGPLLLMTPGRGIPAAHWGRLPALLAERFRVLLYDVRGVGATEVTSDEASMEDIADDLHHLVEAEGDAEAAARRCRLLTSGRWGSSPVPADGRQSMAERNRYSIDEFSGDVRRILDAQG